MQNSRAELKALHHFDSSQLVHFPRRRRRLKRSDEGRGRIMALSNNQITYRVLVSLPQRAKARTEHVGIWASFISNFGQNWPNLASFFVHLYLRQSRQV